MTGVRLLTGFEECTLAAGSFRHREHVEIAWLYLSRYSLLDALARFADGLRRLARSFGASDKYHETITWTFMLLVHERMQRAESSETWAEFAAHNSDLFEWPSPLLARYYSEETLWSDLARKVFVLPDRALGGPPVASAASE